MTDLSVTEMPTNQRALAEAARGFMPIDEGLALYSSAFDAPAGGPWLEVGSYCGKSALFNAFTVEQFIDGYILI